MPDGALARSTLLVHRLLFSRRLATAALLLVSVRAVTAETCTTKDKLPPAQLTAITEAALTLATAVQAGDAAKVRAATIAEYATDFSASEYLIRNTSPKLTGDSLRTTFVYGLDATGRAKDATGEADFSCPQGASEIDFSIAGLPTGNYAFAMVEAAGGARPWLLSFLLRQDAGVWKMAGFYPHARTAVGHDGLWYWNAARAQVKAVHPWAAYLLYGQADTLLRPSNFVTTSHLDKLRNEQRTNTPPELSSGVSADTPLVLTGKGGEFHFTSLNSEASEDGSRVNVMLHMRAEPLADTNAARARNAAAAATFVHAHPELRTSFQGVWVFAEVTGQLPFATEHPMSEIP